MEGFIISKSRYKLPKRPKKQNLSITGSRHSIDIINLYGNVPSRKSQLKKIGLKTAKGSVFVTIAVIVFFMMGYLIAGMTIPLWAKVFMFAFVSVLGFALSYVVANLLY